MADQSSLPESIFEEKKPTETNEVQDIFSDISSPGMAPSPSGAGMNQRQSAPSQELPAIQPQSSSKRLALMIGGGVIVLALIVFVAVMLVNSINRGAQNTVTPAPITPQAITPTPEPIPTPPAPTPEPTPTPVEPTPAPAPTTAVTDTDGDGLSDSDEQALGTSPENVDTDNDGLSDYEESKVYHTNPLNADTDGDGFLDGEEVKGGYNPNGPGKLFVQPANP